MTKKYLSLIAAIVILLSMLVLAGCGTESTPTTPTTPSSEPPASSAPTDPPAVVPTIYWNTEKGSQRTAAADGTYTATFFRDGKQTQLKVATKELMQRIDAQQVCGLVQDENGTVTDMVTIPKISGCTLSMNGLVLSVQDNAAKINLAGSLSGNTTTVQLTDSVKVWNMSGYSQDIGAAGTLQDIDQVTVITNSNDQTTEIFITGREGTYKTEKRHCEKCNAEVDFRSWFSSKYLPFASGHYYLDTDLTLTATTELFNADITLDLNGKTVTQGTQGELIYWMKDGAVLSLMDSVGTGKIVPATSGKNDSYTHQKGLIVRMESGTDSLNIYGGTYDATGTLAQHGGCIDNVSGTLNIYGGTFLGGSTYGAGGGVLCVQSITNIYGGTFTGGHATDTAFETTYVKGGGTVYVGGKGYLTIRGGTFQSGKSDLGGGTINCNGIMQLYGGEILAGEAVGKGNAIFITSFGTMEFFGDTKITGSIEMDPSSSLKVDDACPQTVTRNPDGTVTLG